MNEAETRADLIDPQLAKAGWGVLDDSRILRERHITAGKIQTGGKRAKPLITDYILVYKGRQLAVVEAKSNEYSVGEGVGQAKEYAAKLQIAFTYAANGVEIYQINMLTGAEGLVKNFPTPEELWEQTFAPNEWEERFNPVPFEDISGTKPPRYYQEIAVNNALQAIAENKNRILLTLATGTGKTTIAFHIVWKLYQTRWNLKRDASRRPRVLFLADRNILADQAFSEFTRYSAFPDDALVRIKPDEIRKQGRVPTNGSVFFTIFQTFMSGPNDTPNFGEYPADYFDFIIIDECHRGGANDESNWRGILEYFSPAVQLGLTATPKRKDNVDTYKYFGEPVYVYSLKEGINDGFLTPFKVRRMQSTLDEYIYTSDDTVIEGEVEAGKRYTESDFNRIIEIKEREADRVRRFMSEINQNEKAIVFCATQDHAAAVRDLINQFKKNPDPMYCVRVTANDGALGEQYLEQFKDNDRTIPTILTTSQKLSTGVDARNIRNIILMRPINSMIEFKQIIGRGTRLFDGKEYFTIYDFVDAHHHFADPEWDGDPEEPVETPAPIDRPPRKTKEPPEGYEPKVKLKIKLRDGKERQIEHMSSTLYYSADGRPISAQQFVENLYGVLPAFFQSEEELRKIWSNPVTRKTLLEELEKAGFGKEELSIAQSLINAENSDLLDVLEYISFLQPPISRELRVAKSQSKIFAALTNEQKQFVEFVLSKYIETGVEELDQEKLPHLLTLKYKAIEDAKEILGTIDSIRKLFVEFQGRLYQPITSS
ncbi:MAG: DEAD/DEAH box helicase family protein [Anaerolineae bacterium]|nr:DEAD/DEAH box helicase family protein [Anaerolineae bacterium]MBL8105199.1 DEAD/DEAH box helicase family protein [Anaerolineales bacterium]MCC6298303.1 DEAD/DEAH box helicase family protein [Anaerolineales bacterium]